MNDAMAFQDPHRQVVQRNYAFYSSLVEQIPQNLICKDLNGVITFINQSACDIFGKPYEAIVGKTDFELFPKELAEKYVQDDKHVIKTRMNIDVIENTINAQGDWITVRTVKMPIFDENNRLIGVQIISWDITRQHEYEKKLHENQVFTNAILDSLSSHIAIIDAVGNIIHVNQAWRDFAEENCVIDTDSKEYYFDDMNYLDLCQRVAEADCEESDDARAVYQGIQEVLSRQRMQFFYQYPCHSPHVKRWFNVKITRLNLEHLNHLVVAHENITKQKRLEEMLIQSQKMEAMGKLVSGIAHDFNNLHWIIKSNAEFMLSELEPKSGVYQDVQEIIATVDRASELTHELITFSKNQPLSPVVLHINERIQAIQTAIQKITGPAIELKWDPAPNLYPIRIDPQQFEQVFLDVILNAVDAMPSGGRIQIQTRNLSRDQEELQHHKQLSGRMCVCLCIQDNGVGMTEEVKTKIFDPFFTTKSPGKGTGLGLSTVHSIVEKSGGFILVDSEPNEGTTFRLYFPAVEPEPDTVS